MTLYGFTRAVLVLALGCAGLWGQTVASSLTGTVVDPKGAPVTQAPVTLTSDTGVERSATTDNAGAYRFIDLDAGTYNLIVKLPGFKIGVETGIVVLAQETHTASKMTLQAGTQAETNSVPAAATQPQSANSAESWTIDAADLETLTRKGRDLFDYLKLVPGVIDTRTTGRDVTAADSIQGIVIDGNTSAINFNVDGVLDLDTGSNRRVSVEPNIDSIKEIRVLEANYQAEYGRNSGGVITIVTRNGTQDFHGTGSWNHRNEEFNANSWENNHTLTAAGTAEPRAPYRFNVETFGIGGPAYIPKVANIDKKKLFFYFSQERTAQFIPAPSQYTYMPTNAERTGDFSQTFTNVNGNAGFIPVLDPLTNTQFAGNVIPLSRLSPTGQGLLGFFPTPNFGPTQSNQLYVLNYFEQGSDQYKRRNDVLRIDANITPKITGNLHWINDHQEMSTLFDGVPFNQTTGSAALTTNISPISHPTPGHAYEGSLSYSVTPTLIDEVRVGKSFTQLGWYTTDGYASEAAALEPGLPLLFPTPSSANDGVVSLTNGYHSLLPTFTFGGSGLPSSAYYLRNSASAGAAEEFNNIWSVQDNATKVLGHHIIKAGFYGERNTRIQPAGQNYNGAFSFAASTSTPFLNTNDGYANALLGDVSDYSQYTAETTSNLLYYNTEFYIQDHWKVMSRLTVDAGIRFYRETPPADHDGTLVNFVPSAYSSGAMSRLYYPFCSNSPATCSSATNGLAARDRLTGATVDAAYIGDIVRGSGNPVTGMVPIGASKSLYPQPPLSYGPRFGFALDLFGTGKTVVRGGWGLYRNRLATNTVAGLSGQAPLSFEQTVSNVTFGQIAGLNAGSNPLLTNVTIAPVSPNSWPSSVPAEGVGNGSFDIQHIFGGSTIVDVGATLNYSFNQYLTYDLNYIPIGTSWPFKPSNLNPTTSGATSADIGSIYERSLYPGYGNINTAAFLGSSNYHAVYAKATKQISHSLAGTASYTWSVANGINTYSPEVANNTSYNYGRLPFDRRQSLQIGYVYNLPNLGAKSGHTLLAYATDDWQLSGIVSLQSGAPYDPTCGVTAGQPAPASYTGTPDLAPRCNVVGNPTSQTAASGNGKIYFNPAAFALPALGTGPDNSIVGPAVLGNLGGGAGVLTLPRTTNFDATLTKSFPIFGNEKHVLKIQVQAYNVFNHTEISGINNAIQFNPATNQVSNPTGVGYLNAALPNRVLDFSARLVF